MKKETHKYLKSVRRKKLLEEGTLFPKEKVHKSKRQYKRNKSVKTDD